MLKELLEVDVTIGTWFLKALLDYRLEAEERGRRKTDVTDESPEGLGEDCSMVSQLQRAIRS